MKNDRGTLMFIAGLWCSLLAVTMSVSSLLPPDGASPQVGVASVFLGGEKASLSQKVFVETGKVIRADLLLMQLSLYEDGKLIESVPILSRGRVGTPWETPTGKYLIQSKEKRHFSSIGGTWMPFSLQFYGNFFIHGWPTREDGEDVPIGYSGGCIRLATLDAKKVYDFAPLGTTLIISGSDPKSDFSETADYVTRGEGASPLVSAPSFIVADVETGSVLWEEGADLPYAPRGLIALPVALTALETVNQYKIVRISELLLGHGVLRRHSIDKEDEVPAGALIYPLIYDSNDTAAKVFAREHGTKQFVKYMNEKVRAVEMNSTEFAGPLSSDRGTTTARDLLALTRYVYYSKNYLFAVSTSEERESRSANGKRVYSWENKNPWVAEGDALFRGGVADIDESGAGSALSVFLLPVSEFEKRNVAFVVLRSSDVKKDIGLLREFVSSHYVFGVKRTKEKLAKNEMERAPSFFDRVQALLQKERIMEYSAEIDQGT